MYKFYKRPKLIAAMIIVLLYCLNIFPYAVGYSGLRFTTVATADSFIYAILYIVPLAAIYCALAYFVHIRNKNFYRFEKYTGQVICSVLVSIFFVMLLNGSAGSLAPGYWLSLLCGLIIIFERRIKQTAYNLKTKTV